jgi:acyl-coenzyme A thioesterase PaaI-like protein
MDAKGLLIADGQSRSLKPKSAGWKPMFPKGLPERLESIWATRLGDEWRYGVPVDESHLNAQGILHGGVLMTFMDHGLSLIVWEAAGRTACSTVQINSQFLAAVRPPAFIELRGEIRKRTRSFIFAQGILSVEGSDVMEASGLRSIRAPRQKD